MSYTKEGLVKAHIDRVLKRHSVYYVKPVSSGMGRHGIPDYLCCFHGRFFAIEAKGSDKAHPTPLQQNELAKIQAAGGATFVIKPDNINGLDEWLIKVEKNDVQI